MAPVLCPHQGATEEVHLQQPHESLPACKAFIIKLFSSPKAISPYHLCTIKLWTCHKLPLVQSNPAGHFQKAIKHIKAANQLMLELQRRDSQTEEPQPTDSWLAKKLQ
ncbi:hypothetical protein E2320_002384 [Naja naja]|nr:hypothetical protein E2320_002384 [Naja naja]